MRSRNWVLPALLVGAATLSSRPGPLAPEYRLSVEPGAPAQGQTVEVLVSGMPRWARLDCRFGAAGVPVDLLGDGTRRVLLPIPGDAKGATPLVLSSLGPKGWTWAGTVAVSPGRFPEQSITLESGVMSLFGDPGAPAAKEKLLRTFALYTPEQFWQGPFAWPVEGRESTPFGARRVLQGQIKYFHKGIDLAAKRGSPVRASAAGLVRIAEKLPLQGNVVVLDHGFGVETVYQHMDALLVAPGRRVSKGETLGQVGSTGISTGPHLHWSLYVHGVAVDPADWTRRTF